MEHWTRNFPKPKLAVVHSDCGLSERREIVARICERTNEVQEYYYGLECPKVEAPGQSNVDERMPLTFLRPCINVINAIIVANEMKTPQVLMPSDNLDYHAFVPLTRDIVTALNSLIEEL